MNAPVDAAIRTQALDPRKSFIVQAPAGSGKTELLTRRVLTLLCTVNEPEEILAITFTRKASSEMRQRVIEMLEGAISNTASESAYEQEGLALAQRVLQRDKDLNWRLIDNPQRLNLRTIDSLATQLAYRLPVTSALGAPIGIVENAESLYQEVAARFIESNLAVIGRVLLQVGNKLDRAQQLLANLLANRDQWKRHVYGAGDDHQALRDLLENMLAELVESRLEHLIAATPGDLSTSIVPRLRMAAEFLLADAEGDIASLTPEQQCWIDIEQLPGGQSQDLARWRSIATVLLTNDSKPRKQLTVKLGFPPESDAGRRGRDKATLKIHKQDMLEAIRDAAQSPTFFDALAEIRKLPEPVYADEQWELLSELLSVLPGLLVELQWVFAQRKQVDFTEIAERAQRALGTLDEPTDLALAMDLSLKHVLVDEFQDTSQTQFALFARLVGGWTADDGRTFFAVGDPMQSIYRFRDADVTLFGQAQEQGVGPVRLEPLTLSVNFRAAPRLIEWVNNTFAGVFPDRADPDTGAIPYSASSAFLGKTGDIQFHPLLDTQDNQEALLVAELCASAIKDDKQHQVAILVRSRTQVIDILAGLRDSGLAYQSIDMDPVGERGVVRDLVALVLALRYPHDRLHWLAVLRSPFVGLTLCDLHALMVSSSKHMAVIDLLRSHETVNNLSKDGRFRIERLLAVIEPALKRVPRMQIMPWVEAVWLQLGGPVACHDQIDLNAAERALSALSDLDARGQLWQKSVIETAMQSLFAAPVAEQNCQIQVMTLHKSKGLEFDTVILPALERKPRQDSTQLLNWFESSLDGKPQLLLAPLEQSGLDSKRRDRINRLVKTARERCDEQEKNRLLYVACTRAKQQLHLVGTAYHDAKGDLRSPNKASLLSALWSSVESDFVSAHDRGLIQIEVSSNEQMALDIECDQRDSPRFKRLPSAAQMPAFDVFNGLPQALNSEALAAPIEFSWAGREARDIGTVVHQQLQLLAGREIESLESLRGDARRVVIGRQLKNLGFRSDTINAATDTVLRALENTLSDERGRWILADHADARSEWALSVAHTDVQEGAGTQVRKVVIDRTFVDDSGVRWIVDFKTGDHAGGQVEKFLDQEQDRYSDQLNLYASILRKIDNRPIKVGLYFPMLKKWREWQPD